jgi:hypothetical protein
MKQTMNTYKKIVAVLLVTSTLMFSCTKDFKEINTDPNRIDQISPGTLLNPIIYEVAAFNMLQADNITFDLMQVMLNFPSPSGGIHRYDLTENTGSSTWNTYYRWLKNIKEMYDASVKAQDPNYQAIAMTLKAWVASNLTDCFGDIPMEEALRGDEQLFYPKFDKQEVIYPQLLNDLDSANRLFVTTRAMPYGTEVLFANNVTKWKKFCNSLHMRLLLRLSKKPGIDAYTKLRAMIANPAQYPVFVSNAEAAVLNLTGITPLVSPWGRPVDFPTFRAAGKFFLDSLNAMNDPRRAKFASQARSLTPPNPNIGYIGIPHGYTGPETQFNYTPSNLLQVLVTAPMIVPILPYAEVEFIKAEVEWQAGNAANAQTAYEKGVKAAIEQWGVTMPANYFTNATAAYDGTLQRIMLQKYYALFFVDYQQWFEYRRTRFPSLPVGAGMLNNGVMPSRFEYPLSVRISNPDNYQEAVGWMGGDDINAKVWWER